MQNKEPKTEIAISILITVIGGKETMRRCLKTLRPQIQTVAAEIIVPYDKWAAEIGELKPEFPEVNFPFITDLGIAANPNVAAHQHRLCDRRRAIGLGLAGGQVIAMTEDQVVPAANWVAEILEAHDRLPAAVIGGSIDNAVDEPLHWAAYYCDHGRYGSPLAATEAEYVSDLNISYKREAIEATRDVWREAYSETKVHWALRDRGMSLRLDPALKVYKHRPPIQYGQTLCERSEWGRVFAETRVASISFGQRIFLAAMTPVLPALLLWRNLKHMLRQRRTAGQIIPTLPLIAGLLIAWSWGELVGYIQGEPLAHEFAPVADFNPSASRSE